MMSHVFVDTTCLISTLVIFFMYNCDVWFGIEVLSAFNTLFVKMKLLQYIATASRSVLPFFNHQSHFYSEITKARSGTNTFPLWGFAGCPALDRI